MDETELLKHIYARSEGSIGGHVLIGPGDDCALVRAGAMDVLLTTDQLVEGRHFASETPIEMIAHKAIARSISDIAAMGGMPSFALVAACLPENYAHANALFDAMHLSVQGFGCPLVGGDIASHAGPLVLTVTVMGAAHEQRGPVLRSGAEVGDDVWVTGKLGGSYASGRHLTFTPCLIEARALCDELGEYVHAMIDLSDGAGRDGGRVAMASGCAIELDEAALPMHQDVADWQHALGDGEDYELFFTTAPGVQINTLEATRIGRCVEGEGCWLIDRAGTRHDVSTLGWDHSG